MRVLYITYTGISENLGKSQILPYIRGLAEAGVEFDVISFEKEDSFFQRAHETEREVADLPVHCHFVNRRDKSPAWRRALAVLEAIVLAAHLARRQKYELVHCRNAFAAECALMMHYLAGIPFLFDMRGFWGDARKETGQWNTETLRGKLTYRLWKWRERTYLRKSTITNCLTENVREWIVSHGYKSASEVIVTPCCVDFDAVLREMESRRPTYDRKNFTCVYLGSMGGVYDDMRVFTTFRSIRAEFPGARLLFIGSMSSEKICSLSSSAGVDLHRSEFEIARVEHRDVFGILNSADIGISFYKPGFYATGVSSTKISEYLAVGLPVICNDGIGDIKSLLSKSGGGLALPNSSRPDDEDRMIRAFLRELCELDRNSIRQRSADELDIRLANSNYLRAYQSISMGDVAGG